ncbi:hypothetical protein ACUTAF_19575 [Pseudomonas sp. SP16.1]|uniref:hypothetical protein n=1 Tax=Pseudomonas sp. SP16.1 TaxID=3458854 RepID=UPI0040453CB8
MPVHSDIATAIETLIREKVAQELEQQREKAPPVIRQRVPDYAKDFASPETIPRTPAQAPLKALPSDFHVVLERGEDHRTVALTASGGGHQQRFLVQRDYYGRAIGVRPVEDAHSPVEVPYDRTP